MPGLDGTGPDGQGPKTGRKSGKCNSEASKSENGNRKDTSGRGQGRGLKFMHGNPDGGFHGRRNSQGAGRRSGRG